MLNDTSLASNGNGVPIGKGVPNGDPMEVSNGFPIGEGFPKGDPTEVSNGVVFADPSDFNIYSLKQHSTGTDNPCSGDTSNRDDGTGTCEDLWARYIVYDNKNVGRNFIDNKPNLFIGHQ